MKNLFLLCSSMILLLASCECTDETFVIIDPNPFYVVQFGGGDDLFFMDFNKPVDTSSFLFGANATFGLTRLCASKIRWSQGNTRMSFCASYDSCYSEGNDYLCKIRIQLIGAQNDTLPEIKSLEGQVLDGDFDGSDGGDFREEKAIVID